MRSAQQDLIPRLVLVLALGSLGYLGYLVFWASPQTPLIQTDLALITIALLVGIRGALFWRPLPLGAINPCLAGIAGLLLVNCAAGALSSANEDSVLFLALVLVGSGGFILSRSWLGMVCAAAWLIQLWLLWHGPTGDSFDLGILALSTVLTFSIHHFHIQMYRRAILQQTAERRAQQSLREAMLSAPTFEGVLVHDQGRVIQANQAAGSLFGLLPNEVIGREINLFFAVDAWPLVTDSVRLGNLQAIETTCVRTNGSPFPAEVFSQKVAIDNQFQVVTVIRDISDRKRAELSLEEERRQTALLFQRQGVLLEIERTIERPGHPAPMLSQVVQAAAHLLPATLGSCLLLRDESGQLQVTASAFRIHPPPDNPFQGFKPGRAVQWIMDQQESLVISDLASDSFGIREVFPRLNIEAYVGVPILSAGVISGLLFSFDQHSRTYKKEELDFLSSLASKASALLARIHLIQSVDSLSQKLQAQRRDHEKQATDLARARDLAQTATQDWSAFVRHANQEWRTALRILSDRIQSLLLTSLSEEQQQAAESVRRQTEDWQDRLTLFTDFAQIMEGALKIQSLDFDLNEVLKNAIRPHLTNAQKKNLELICQTSGPIPRNLRGDAARIQQVLTLLLTNAIQFTEHGQVEVRVTQTQPAPGQIRLRFDVRDTGPGVPPGSQDQLFTPLFARRPAPISSPPAPLKLGLVVCRSLVELMGGQIGVQSLPGSGSTFWFTVHVQEASILKSA
jgi:PAS domain S-box-containing protein